MVSHDPVVRTPPPLLAGSALAPFDENGEVAGK